MKFGIREAVEVVFKTTKAYTGEGTDFLLVPGQVWDEFEPVMYFDSLKMSTTEGTATTVYAQGGAGNPRLIAWEGDKTITFTFEDALISPEGMAILTGAGLVEASGSAKVRVHRKKAVNVLAGSIGSQGAVTLDFGVYNSSSNTDGLNVLGTGEALYAPAAPTDQSIYAFVLDANGEITDRIPKTVITGSTNGEVKIGSNSYLGTGATAKSVLVDFYVEKESNVKEITITPDKFAGYFYIEGETLFRRQSDGADLPAQIVVPNAKIQTAFTFSMSSTGDPSTFTFTADAFPGTLRGGQTTDKVLYAIQLFEN